MGFDATTDEARGLINRLEAEGNGGFGGGDEEGGGFGGEGGGHQNQ